MQEIIDALNEFTLDNKDYLNLGDSSPIINEFNEFQDLDNLKRVRETIEEMI